MGWRCALVAIGATLKIKLTLAPPEPLASPVIGIGVNNAVGQRIFTVSNQYGRGRLGPIRGHCTVVCTLSRLNLAPGQYSLKIAIGSAGRDMDTINDAICFEIAPCDYLETGRLPGPSQGVVIQESVWEAIHERSCAGA
jgi:hypothetical protein